MMTAENYVINNGLADVISQSFAATEETFPNNASIRGLRGAYWNAKHHNVTVVGATGDAGATEFKRNITDYYRHRVTAWPSTDPLVTAIGGTQLHLDADGNRTAPDNVWNDSYNSNVNGGTPSPIAGGGGASHVFPRPKFQNGVAGVTGDGPRGPRHLDERGRRRRRAHVPRRSGRWLPAPTSSAAPARRPRSSRASSPIADQAAGHDLGFPEPDALQAGHGRGRTAIVDVTKGDNTVTLFYAERHDHVP